MSLPVSRRLLALSFILSVSQGMTSADEASVGAPSSQARIVQSWDAGWKFHMGDDQEARQVEFNDNDWQKLDVPHDWSIEGPFDENNPAGGDGGFLPTGVGWYRRHFTVPATQSGKRHFVQFDGVMANSDVWLNGRHLGHRSNGYVSFEYELTDHVKYGGDNVLAVCADTSHQPASRWYAGSGIYRHVRLVSVDPLHVEYGGVFVTTPSVSREEATVEIALEIRNQGAEEREIEVHTVLQDEQGREVAAEETSLRAGAGAVREVKQSFTVSNPQLWDIEDPQLYTAVTSIRAQGETLDEVRTPFGIREIEFKSDTGFWLNGRNLKLKGVCLHHDGGAVGAAVPLEIWRYRLLKLRGMGVNALRPAHGPFAPEFLDLCDRLGLLVMDEFFDCWTVAKRRFDYHRHFTEWAHRDARDTIRRDRNHPCIVLYSAGNEIRDTPKEEHAKGILRGLLEVYHETDPTRPVTQALFRPNVSHDYDNGLADMLDVIGTNYRDQELLAAWRDKPSRRIVGTEQSHERSTWLACRDNPQHSGQFLWVGIDYLGESRRWPVTTFNAGLLDRTGYPQPRGLERQSWWSDRPMVAAMRRRAPTEATPTDPGYEVVEWERPQVLFPDWTPRDLAPHDENVEVYSNCDEVELVLNERSLGKKPLPADASSRNWNVPFEPGLLAAVGLNDGREVVRHELRTAGEPAKLVLAAHKKRLQPTWDDVAIIEVRIADAGETTVPTANNLVKFSIVGPGEIVAVDNGSIVSHELFQASDRRAYQGRCIAIVRATGDAGTIEVTATSDGLQPATVRLEAIPTEEGQP